MNKDRVVGYLMKCKGGSLQKLFFFLRADVSNMATVKTNGKVVKKGKGKGMEVPCTITFTVSKQVLSKLKEVL